MLFSRWITPEVIATRFDAWFFLALAPAHTPPQARRRRDHRGALVRARRRRSRRRSAGEIVLSFPTQTQLRWLAEFRTSDEAIAAYRERRLEPILPVVIAEDGAEPRVVLPGDPDYPA